MKPLRGVRVLDLSRLVPGPLCSLVLADLGATVDRVEEPGAGDMLRYLSPNLGGASAAFHLLNRGKRSLVLDLKRGRGPDVLRRLVPSYDVLLEQFRPGVLGRLGLGHDHLRELNPRLIVCALTGYGQTGPAANRAGHDIGYLATAGVFGWQGPADHAPPPLAIQAADVGGALWSVIAILAALRSRDASGQGAVLDISMTESALSFAPLSLAAALNGEPGGRGTELLTGGLATYGTYASSDGWPVAVGILEPKFWVAFCSAVGLEPDLNALRPGPHQPKLRETLTGLFASRSSADWRRFAEQHDCCVEVAVAPEALRGHGHLAERGVWLEVPTVDGPVTTLRTPVMEGATDEPARAAPRAGEHSRDILSEAGFSRAEVEELLSSGVVRGG